MSAETMQGEVTSKMPRQDPRPIPAHFDRFNHHAALILHFASRSSVKPRTTGILLFKTPKLLVGSNRRFILTNYIRTNILCHGQNSDLSS